MKATNKNVCCVGSQKFPTFLTDLQNSQKNINFSLTVFDYWQRSKAAFDDSDQNLQAFNTELKQKNIFQISLAIDTKNKIKFLSMFNNVSCETFILRLASARDGDPGTFSVSDCIEIFNKIDRCKFNRIKLILYTSRINKEFILKVSKLIRVGEYKLNLLYCFMDSTINSFECGNSILDNSHVFETVGFTLLRYKSLHDQFGLKLVKYKLASINIAINCSQFDFGMRLLLNEHTMEKSIFFSEVVDLKKILPLWFVRRKSQKITIKLTIPKNTMQKEELKITLGTPRSMYFYDATAKIKARFPLVEDEVRFLKNCELMDGFSN